MSSTTSQPLIPTHPQLDAPVDHDHHHHHHHHHDHHHHDLLIPNPITIQAKPSSPTPPHSSPPPTPPPILSSHLDLPTPSSSPDHKSSSSSPPPPPSPPPLLILDLNGCLVHRQFGPTGKTVVPRPHLDQLFDYIFDQPPDQSFPSPNWEIVIWSSAQPQNVERMCEAIHLSKRPTSRSIPTPPYTRQSLINNQLNDISNRFNSLTIDPNTTTFDPRSNPRRPNPPPPPRHVLDVWDRSMMDLSSQDYNRKVQTTKDLSKLWKKLKWTDPTTGQTIRWGAHNTLIVDDSPDKLSLQPDNLCLIEEFKGQKDDRALVDLVVKLKSIRDHSNIPQALKNLKSNKQLNIDHINEPSNVQSSTPGEKERSIKPQKNLSHNNHK